MITTSAFAKQIEESMEEGRRMTEGNQRMLAQFSRAFGTPGPMITPLDIARADQGRDLTQASDHDRIHNSETIYSRGYHAGYARAMTHTEETSWTQRLPLGQIGAVRSALNAVVEAAITVYRVESPNRFGVRFVRIRVDLLG